MNRKLNFEISETTYDLKTLLLNEKDPRIRERIQLIYLIKSGEITKLSKASKILVRDRRTLGTWVKTYEKFGLETLLERRTSDGRPSCLTTEQYNKLEFKLSESGGFKSYKHIGSWILEEFGIDIAYKTVFRICHDKLGARPKVSRPKNPKQDEEELELLKKKTFSEVIDKTKINSKKEVKVWFQDEARFGLITEQRRKITLKGVKPIGLKQFEFENFWMYGVVEPLSGDSFFMEYSVLDSVCFGDFLSQFSKQNPKSTNLIFLDGSRAHTAKALKIPKNIILHLIPPYSPELNPKERIWQDLKKETCDELFENLNSLRTFLYDKVNNLTKNMLRSLSFYPYIREYFTPKPTRLWLGV